MSEKNNNETEVIYVVNGRIPNSRAHSIQIVHTCEALGEHVTLTLVSPKFLSSAKDVYDFHQIKKNFIHTKLFALDLPIGAAQFYVRSATFALSANLYLLGRLLINMVKRRKLVLYVRGEVVFSLVLISYLVPIIFETHQIRNHEIFYKKILQRVKGVVVITNNLKTKFVDDYHLPAEKIQVARDAVDIAKFSVSVCDKNILQTYGIPDNKKVLLYCGSLTREKGVFTLADAASKLHDDYHVVFAGGAGEQLNYFRELYADRKNISCIGHVAHEQVPKLLACAYMVVQPDLATDRYANLYTSPMKLFEYMASGRPVLAADVPSIREVLTDSSALFFTSGDPSSLAQVANLMVNETDTLKSLGLQSHQDASQFTWSKRGEDIALHIEKVTS